MPPGLMSPFCGLEVSAEAGILRLECRWVCAMAGSLHMVHYMADLFPSLRTYGPLVGVPVSPLYGLSGGVLYKFA